MASTSDPCRAARRRRLPRCPPAGNKARHARTLAAEGNTAGRDPRTTLPAEPASRSSFRPMEHVSSHAPRPPDHGRVERGESHRRAVARRHSGQRPDRPAAPRPVRPQDPHVVRRVLDRPIPESVHPGLAVHRTDCPELGFRVGHGERETSGQCGGSRRRFLETNVADRGRVQVIQIGFANDFPAGVGRAGFLVITDLLLTQKTTWPGMDSVKQFDDLHQ